MCSPIERFWRDFPSMALSALSITGGGLMIYMVGSGEMPWYGIPLAILPFLAAITTPYAQGRRSTEQDRIDSERARADASAAYLRASRNIFVNGGR